MLKYSHFNKVNEIRWNYAGDLFFMTTGLGDINILEYASFELAYTLQAHSSTCSAIAFDPIGRYFATGGGDATTLLWDLENLISVQSYSRLEYFRLTRTPIRTISFSFDGEMIATASEDTYIDIAHVQSGELIHQVECHGPLNAVSWHPSKHLLAYAVEESGRHAGRISVFGF